MSNTAPASPALQGAAAPSRSARAQAAIADAAQATGIDFGYLLAQARIESGLDPNARARTSSASGLFQFVDQTWLATMDRHGERLGLGQLAQAIDTGANGRARVSDPAMRTQIMNLRFDPTVASLMAGALATDNRAALTGVLGREPDASELYLAHFLGEAGAGRFLATLQANPDASAAGVLPAAARANRAIFFERSGNPRSVGQVMDVIRGRMANAMDAGFDPQFTQGSGMLAAAPAMAQITPRSHAFALPAAPAPTALAAGLPSMASRLADSFGLATGNTEQPGLAHVRRAYARLSAMGL